MVGDPFQSTAAHPACEPSVATARGERRDAPVSAIGSQPRTTRVTSRTGLAVVLGAAALLLFANLGGPIYEVRDVARYAQMILEMRASDTLVPTLMSKPYHEAMPLATWAPYASAELLGGLSPLAVRLPSALAWFATIVLTVVIGRRASDRVGLIAGAAMTTNYLTLEYARGSRIEGILLLAVTASIAAYLLAGDRKGVPRALWYVASGVAGALAFAAKGPYAVALIIAALGPFVAFERRWRERVAGAALAAVVLVVLSLAWVVPYANYLGAAGTRAFVDQMLLRETVQKFASGYGKAGPLFEYVVAVPLKLAPWSLAAIAALVSLVRRRRGSTQTEILCASWFLAPLVLLSLASGKHIRYVVPLLPALCVLAAIEVDAWLGSSGPRARRVLAGANVVVASIVLAVGVAAPAAHFLLFGWSVWVAVTTAIAVAAGVVALLRSRRGELEQSMLATHVGVAAIVAFVFAGILALPQQAESSSEHFRLAAQLDDALADNEPVFVSSIPEGPVDPYQLALYLRGHEILQGSITSAPRQARLLAQRPAEGYRVNGMISWQDDADEPATLLLSPAEAGTR